MQDGNRQSSSAQELDPSTAENQESRKIIPNANDVLCGRGGSINSHSGNEQFRSTVNKHRAIYLNARFKQEKRLIAASIVDNIKALDPPGRFLAKSSDFGEWYAIGDERARDKTSQALRENASNIRQKDKITKSSGSSNKKQRKRQEKNKSTAGKGSTSSKVPSYASIVPPNLPPSWPSGTYNPYYAAQQGSTNPHKHYPVPGPYRCAQYPAHQPKAPHHPLPPPTYPVSFPYQHTMPQPLPAPLHTQSYQSSASSQSSSFVSSSPGIGEHTILSSVERQSSNQSSSQLKETFSDITTKANPPPEIEASKNKIGNDKFFHQPIKSPPPLDSRPQQSISQPLHVDTRVVQSPTDAYLMSPGAAAAEAIINMPPSSSPMLESPTGSLVSPGRKRAPLQSSVETDLGRNEKRPRQQTQDNVSASLDYQGARESLPSTHPSTGSGHDSFAHFGTLQSSNQFSVGNIAVPYSPIKTSNEQPGASSQQTDQNSSFFQSPPPKSGRIQAPVGQAGVMASSLLSHFAQQVASVFDADALCGNDSSNGALAPTRKISSPQQDSQPQEESQQVARLNIRDAMDIKIGDSTPNISGQHLNPPVLARTPSWERNFRGMYEEVPAQPKPSPMSGDLNPRKVSTFASVESQNRESSLIDSSVAFGSTASIEEGSLTEEALNTKIVTELQQQENNTTLNAHRKRRQPVLQANLNRTARSSAFDHHLATPPARRSHRQEHDDTTLNEYNMNDQTEMSGDYQSPLPPEQALDFNIAFELQKAEQVAIGTMQQLERMARLDQEDKEAHENRNARSRGYKDPPA